MSSSESYEDALLDARNFAAHCLIKLSEAGDQNDRLLELLAYLGDHRRLQGVTEQVDQAGEDTRRASVAFEEVQRRLSKVINDLVEIGLFSNAPGDDERIELAEARLDVVAQIKDIEDVAITDPGPSGVSIFDSDWDLGEILGSLVDLLGTVAEHVLDALEWIEESTGIEWLPWLKGIAELLKAIPPWMIYYVLRRLFDTMVQRVRADDRGGTLALNEFVDDLDSRGARHHES